MMASVSDLRGYLFQLFRKRWGIVWKEQMRQYEDLFHPHTDLAVVGPYAWRRASELVGDPAFRGP